MAHWRDINGDLYENATLRDARRLNLLPSVTDVLKQIYSYSLEKWKIRKGIDAAFSYVYKNYMHENCLTGFDTGDIDRILETFLIETDIAKDFGTTIHNLLERYCKGENINLYEYDVAIKNAYNSTIFWIRKNVKNVVASERTWVSKEHGYAGQIDLIAEMFDGKLALIDFKTQGNIGKELRVYENFPWQLAAYKMMYDENSSRNIDTCINLVISSIDGGVKAAVYDADKIYRSKIVFLSALNVFRYRNNFIWEEQ
jgi:hypothetical protein